MSAVAAVLPDGRLHLQHGPIDCLCRVWGEPAEIRAAYRQAAVFFADVLDGLCAELPLLRRPLPCQRPDGRIAQAMHAACLPFSGGFITPMAAVAGAVADAVMAATIAGRAVTRGFVNNGGDIAFHLAPGEALRCGLVTDLANPLSWREASPRVPWPGLAQPSTTLTGRARKVVGGGAKPGHDGAGTAPSLAGREATRTRDIRHAADTWDAAPGHPGSTVPNLDGTFLLTAAHPARGLATSGRACKGLGGRSFSFGIADSVTVLARTAARADAAATIIGNAVDLPGHPAIDRRPASQIDPSTDLDDRLITFGLGPLSEDAIGTALDAGAAMADSLLRSGLIDGAVLALRGELRICHPSPALLEPA